MVLLLKLPQNLVSDLICVCSCMQQTIILMLLALSFELTGPRALIILIVYSAPSCAKNLAFMILYILLNLLNLLRKR